MRVTREGPTSEKSVSYFVVTESNGIMHSTKEDAANVAHEFDTLASQWERETRNLSAIRAITLHPAYRKIISLGWQAVPLILNRIQRRPAFWFEALERITGENPVKPSMRGDVQRMIEAWVAWGIERGLI